MFHWSVGLVGLRGLKVFFNEIIQNLHVLDFEAHVISHLHFIRRKKGRHTKKMKSTVHNSLKKISYIMLVLSWCKNRGHIVWILNV